MDKGLSEANVVKWKSLYRIAGYSTIVMLIIIPIQIAVFSISPMPSSVEDWFALFHNNWFLGLVHQDMLYIINNILVAVLYLAFYFSLREKNESLMSIALLLGLLGISAYLASNKSFEMLKVSSLYYDAVTDGQKLMLLSAGQSLLSGWQGTSFNTYYVLNGIALIIISYVMLKNQIYSKKTAGFGLISGILMMIPSTAGTIGIVFSLASLIPWIIFSILIAKRFFQFGSEKF